MTTYQIRSPLAMCACAISGSLSILLLVEPSFNEGLTHRLIVPVAVSIGLVSMAIITGVLAHGHGIRTAAGSTLALVSVGLSLAIVWEQSGRRAQVTDAKAAAHELSADERIRIQRRRAEVEDTLGSCPKGREKDEGVKCGLRDAMTKECASGSGKRCNGIRTSIATYEAAISGYDVKLKAVPVSTADPKAVRVSELASLTGRDGKIAARWVTLLDPLLVPLLLELAAIICGVVAFGPRVPLAPRVTMKPNVPSVPETSENPYSNGRIVEIVTEKTADETRIIEALKQRGGEVYSQRHLSIILGLSPAEICRMLKRCDPAKVEKVWNPQSKTNIVRLRA